MKDLQIASAVVLYNPTNEDIENINSYLKDVDILYVLDNSPKRNDKRLPENKKIQYIFNDNNLGISIPLNMAAQMARDNNYKWLLTMDQDTSFDNEVLKKMKERIEKMDCNNIGIVTPWHNTKLNIKKSKEKIEHPLDVMTSGNLLNLEIHQKIGGFQEDLFIDGVDIEYCLKLAKNGYKITRFNDLEIKHNLGNIFYKQFLWKELLITNHSAMRRYYQCRNYHYIKEKYKDDFPQFCNTLVKVKATILGIILYENDKLNKIRAYYLGYKDYKLGRKGKSYEKTD